jgi:hypothetical protein
VVDEEAEGKEGCFVDDLGAGAGEVVELGEGALGGYGGGPDGADGFVIGAATGAGDAGCGYGAVGAEYAAGAFGHGAYYGFGDGAFGFDRGGIDA